MPELGLIKVGESSEQPIELDILFLHGLGGDSKKSWGGPDKSGFWPEWLLSDLHGVAIYSLGYPAPKFHATGANSNMPMYDKANEVCDYIISSGLGKRPTIIVCHSLGGLIVKQFMRNCESSADKHQKSLIENIRGIVFLATPHDGSLGADIATIFELEGNSKIVEAMKFDSDKLRELKEWFKTVAFNRDIKVKAYYEMKRMKGALIVSQNSANPDVHGCVPSPADADHVTIAKPANQNSPVYKGVLQFIIDCQKDALVPMKDNPEVSRLDDEINKYKTQLDRLSLEEKLQMGGRDYDIPKARIQRESFGKKLLRHAAQRSSLELFTKLMGQVETRFDLHVYPKIMEGADIAQVNSIIQNQVVDPIITAYEHEEGVNAGLVMEMVYYLTGLCYIRWHK